MTHTPLPPFAAYAGSRSPRLLLIGEAWGQREDEYELPFIGASGQLLFQILGEALGPHYRDEWEQANRVIYNGAIWHSKREDYLNAAGIGMTNVLALRPPDNKLEALCIPKSELSNGGKDYPLPRLTQSGYLREEYLGELSRLEVEITASNPSLIVPLGNAACWAVLKTTGIGAIRGTVNLGVGAYSGRKILPSYHPAGVMRNWDWREILKADLTKAWIESETREIRRPARRILVEPDLDDLTQWIDHLLASPPAYISSDIETAGGQITCIGFAPTRGEALVVPFWRGESHGRKWWGMGNYWATPSREISAWKQVKRLLEAEVPKLFQNGMYDLQYIWRMGIRPRQCLHDSMLLHHSILPEMQKGLGFLGSVYTSEPAWKLMRRSRADTEKADE